MIKKIFLIIISIFIFSGCGSSIYNYTTQPIILEKGISKYKINTLNLEFSNGHGFNNINKSFSNEKLLKLQFKNSITKYLKLNNIYSEDGYLLDINIHFIRTFNYGGNSLNKPEFKYSVNIKDFDKNELVNYSIPWSTTKYSYFKDIAVNLQISTYQRKSQHEIEDVDLISETLAKEIKNIGK